MRPFVWGGSLLLVVVAFLVTTSVRFASYDEPATATVITVGNVGHGEAVTVRSERGPRLIPTRPVRKVKPARDEDLKTPLHTFDVDGFGYRSKEAWEVALGNAQNEVMHRL